jgi:hypothetical protein
VSDVQLKVELTRGADNLPVEGFIVKLAQNHIDDFANLWLSQLRVVEADDKFWDWEFKLGLIDRNLEYEGYALEAEGCTQGLMKIETQRHGSIQARGQRLVYIQYLTSAPWNRKEILSPQRFRGTGTNLLRYARLRSVELGYKGRVGLHSLPKSEQFYENQLMTNCGKEEGEEEEDNLIYFEYGPLQQL